MRPLVWLSTSRTCIGRAWSTRVPPGPITLVAANAGMYAATGSVRRNFPSSRSSMSAVLTMGLVIE
ncbi:unannotated protein [freshwater metagenome]|uniref:Unannotated protein n=1 Tax=freshwater metagenome TaxID=449393 RepID=A0A6J6RFT4_9ZZZZ